MLFCILIKRKIAKWMCFLFCFSCFISHANTVAFYISLLGPACCILIINTVVFTLVARVILKPKFRGHPNGGKRENVTPTQVRGAFTVMVLLGVTWVFGPVAIDESKLVFNYIFVVLNSLQGFLIFIFRCLINTEVRLCWLYLLKTGKFKRRRGPIKSTTESSSSKAFHDSKMNNCSTIDSTIDTNNPSNGRLSVTSGNGHENEFREYDKNKNKHDSFGLDNFKKTWGIVWYMNIDIETRNTIYLSQCKMFEIHRAWKLHATVARCFTSRDSMKYASDRHRKTYYMYIPFIVCILLLWQSWKNNIKYKKCKLRVKFWCLISYFLRWYLCLDAALEKM